MDQLDIPSGIAYCNLDFFLSYNNFVIDVITIYDEKKCYSAKIEEECFFHLCFYKEGKIDFIHDNKKYYIEPDTFVLYPDNFKHSEVMHEEGLTKYHIVFSVISKKRKNFEKYLNKYQFESDLIFKTFTQDELFHIIPDTSKKIADVFEKIAYELETKKIGFLYMINYLLSEVFITFCRSVHFNINPSLNCNDPVSNLLRSSQISYYLYDNFTTVTLKDVALKFHLSERQIQRYINNFHKTSFSKRINELKIKKSKELLALSNLSITEISVEIGFNSLSFFIRIFKAHENTTPLQYRKASKSKDI